MKKYIIMALISIGMVLTLCSCGKDSEKTMLDDIAHNSSESNSVNKEESSQKTVKVNISKATVDMLIEHKETVEKILESADITENEGTYSGDISEDKIKEIRTNLSDIVSESVADISSKEKVIVSADIENGNLTVTAEAKDYKDMENDINDIAVISGIYNSLDSKNNKWSFIINFYDYGKDDVTYKYGAAGVAEDVPYKTENIEKYDTASSSDAD